MTKDKDFKNLVRARMRATGANYTTARQDLLDRREQQSPRTTTPPLESAHSPSPAWVEARRQHDLVVGRFIREGKLIGFPARRKSRVDVLLHLLELFTPGRRYEEPEVNQILDAVVDDHAFWRRELVNYGYLQREAGIYWLSPRTPERPAHMAQEIPDWERLWLPGFLGTGTTT